MELWRTIMKTLQIKDSVSPKKNQNNIKNEKIVKEEKKNNLEPKKQFIFIENQFLLKETLGKEKILQILRDWTLKLQKFTEKFSYILTTETVFINFFENK